MRKYLLPIAAIVFIGMYYSCTKDKTAAPIAIDCTGVNPLTNTYNSNIGFNIIDNYCSYSSACHGSGPSNGIDMSTYAATVNTFKTQNVICAVKGAGCELMPKSTSGLPALPDSLILQMQCWAQNGFPQ